MASTELPRARGAPDPLGLGAPGGRLDVFLATSGTAVLLALLLAHALGPLVQDAPLRAAALALAVGLPPVLALTRVPRDRGGCVAVPAGLALFALAWALGRPGLEGALLLGAPSWALAAWALVLRPLGDALAARAALRALAGAPDANVGDWLGHPAAAVRKAAADRLAAAPGPVALSVVDDALRLGDARARAAALAALARVARRDGPAPATGLLRDVVRLDDAARAADAAAALAALEAREDLLLATAPAEPRPAVRVAYAEGLLRATEASDGTGQRASLAATLLASVLGDPAVPEAERQRALDALDRVPPAEARAAVCPLAARDAVTAEALWALVDLGGPNEAPLLARWVAHDGYEVANAAVEALEAIVDRAAAAHQAGAPQAAEAPLGAATAATRDALAAGRARLRAHHPPGENRLADALVARLEALEAALAPPG